MSEKNSGFWGSLRGLVVADVPDKNSSAPPPQVAVPPQAGGLPQVSVPPQAGAPASSVFPSAPPPSRPTIDPVARERLEQAIAAEAPQGYSEITSDLTTLADAIPDEASRFRAAIKLAAKHGLTVDVLLNDMDKCIGILEAKGREFEDETKRQIERKVGARQAAVAKIDEEIKGKQELMAQLQAEISALSEQRGTEAATIATEEARIRNISINFTVTYESVYQQLAELRSKISTYGKGS